jgi:16S rRNA (guanine527-N7)-methyltransferase
LWERHLLNSAACVPYLDGARSIIDLGSGAGLPGVVVAALCPAAQVTLLEAMERRVAWLEEVVHELGLTHVVVVRARAEDAGTDLAEAVVARAVGPLRTLYRWAAPLLRPGGRLVALKGARAAEEVAEARKAARTAGLTRIEVLPAPTIDGLAPTTVVVAQRAQDGD